MSNDHAKEKTKIENRYGKDNVLWGDEVSDLGVAVATLGAMFGVSEAYEYFADKLDGLKKFGIDAIPFLASKGNPNDYILYVSNINIDFWETVMGKKIYFKRSYRYFMAVRKK
nr:hypothetical protein [uncultured Desulfobacter sp.]